MTVASSIDPCPPGRRRSERPKEFPATSAFE